MSENLDRRARKSRAAIFAAFESLLLEKSYSSLTVSDIIERADVGRSTFYAHFSTKEALLEELCGDIFRHVLSPDEEEAHSFTNCPDEQLLHVLHHLRAQRDRLEPLFKSPSSGIFWTVLLAQVDRYFNDSIGRNIQKRAGIPESVYAHFLATSFVEIVKWWFEQALSLDPNAVLHMYLSLTSLRFVVREVPPEVRAKANETYPNIVESIKSGLTDLLTTKQLDKITIAELCKRSCVSRSTFYNHFENIEEAYKELIKDVFANVRSVIDNFAHDERVACNECGKMPFCERIRVQDEYAPIIQDPAFADAYFDVIGNESSSSQTLGLLSKAGFSDAQARAIMLFQASGCLVVAKSQLGSSEEWRDVKDALDGFISSGYANAIGKVLIQ